MPLFTFTLGDLDASVWVEIVICPFIKVFAFILAAVTIIQLLLLLCAK